MNYGVDVVLPCVYVEIAHAGAVREKLNGAQCPGQGMSSPVDSGTEGRGLQSWRGRRLPMWL